MHDEAVRLEAVSRAAFVRPKRRMYSPRPGKYSFRCRSCWMRSRLTTSAVGSTSSRLCETVTPSCSNSRGTSVLGPTSVTRAPSFKKRKNIRARDAAEKDVADDGDVQSGHRALLFANRVEIEQPLGGMLVRAVAGVDHAGRRCALARNCGAPAELCRRTMMSAWFASRTRAVSLSVSPFVRLEAAAEMLMMSALRRLAASSKEVRVRVLGSTKRLISVLPCSAGTFLTSRVPTCLNASAVSRTSVDLLGGQLAQAQQILARPAPRGAIHFPPVSRARRHLARGRYFPGAPAPARSSGGQILADIIRPDRQFAVAAIDQGGELNAGGTAEGTDRVHRRATGAAGERARRPR